MTFKGLTYPRLIVFLSRLFEVVFYPLSLLIEKRAVSGPIKKILIVEPFNMGDVISLAIMLDPLRRRFSEAEIHLLTKTLGSEIYHEDRRVARIYSFDLPWARRERKWDLLTLDLLALLRLFRTLRRARFDIGIDTRGDIRTQILMVILGCKVRVGYTNYLCSNVRTKGLLLTHNAGDMRAMQRFLINLEVIKLLGCPVAEYRPRPLMSKPSRSNPGALKILCHTGAGWKYRLWQASRWCSLIGRILDQYEVRITVIGSEEERAQMEVIRGQVPETVQFEVTNLKGLIDRIREADLLLCLDSGPMHIAAACEIPLVALFGPGYTDVWKPYSLNSLIIHHQEKFPCAPCLQKSCLFPEANCMDAITAEEVLGAVEKMIPSQFRKTL